MCSAARDHLKGRLECTASIADALLFLTTIGRPELATHNHMALDQLMDLRNDTMKVIYPFANVVTKPADFKAGLKEHVAQTASMHLAKLEGHCVGPYLCGGEIQSADFHMFEMLDQHVAMCEQVTQCATPTRAHARTLAHPCSHAHAHACRAGGLGLPRVTLPKHTSYRSQWLYLLRRAWPSTCRPSPSSRRCTAPCGLTPRSPSTSHRTCTNGLSPVQYFCTCTYNADAQGAPARVGAV